MGTDHAPFMPASECMYGSKNLNTFSAYINAASNQYIRIVWVFKELWPGADQIYDSLVGADQTHFLHHKLF